MQRPRYLLLTVVLFFGVSLLVPIKSPMVLVCHVTGQATEIFDSGITADYPHVSVDDCCGEKSVSGGEILTKAPCCDLMTLSLRQTASAAQFQTQNRVTAFATALLPAPVATVFLPRSQDVCDVPLSASVPPRAPPALRSSAPRAPPEFA